MQAFAHRFRNSWFKPVPLGATLPSEATPPNNHWAEKYMQVGDAAGAKSALEEFVSPDASAGERLTAYPFNVQGKSAVASSQALDTQDFNPPTFTLTRFDDELEQDAMDTRPLSLSGLSSATRSPATYNAKNILQSYSDQDLGLETFRTDNTTFSEDTDSIYSSAQYQSGIGVTRQNSTATAKTSRSFASTDQAWATSIGQGLEPARPPLPLDRSATPWYQTSPWREQLSSTGQQPYLPPKVDKGKGKISGGQDQQGGVAQAY